MNILKLCLSILSAVSVGSLSILSYAQQAMVTPNYRELMCESSLKRLATLPKPTC